MKSPTSIGHTDTFIIRNYEIDFQKIATVPALIKLMHEAAMQNVINIKLSVWDMEPHHIAWVLMRKYLKINHLPSLGEQIKVVTSPTGFEKFFTYRDYYVYNAQDELLAFSSSTWLLMDTKSRKMARIPDFILAFQHGMPALVDCLPRAKSRLAKFTRVDYCKSFRVDWFHLDFNKHVNNVFYTQWMLEALPEDVLKSGRLTGFDILFKLEGHLNEAILSEVQRLEEQTFLHRLVRKEDGKHLAFAETRWDFPQL